MSAEHVRNLLLKRAWVILIFTACGLFGALVGTAFMTPIYQSTVTLHAVVSPETPNTYALLVLDRFIGTETQLASSPAILGTVAKNYSGESAQTLKSRVTSTAEQNTQLFHVAVVDSNPERAAALANSIAVALIADQQQTMKQRNLLAEQDIQQEISTTQVQIQSVTTKLNDPHTSAADMAGLKAQLQSLQEAYQQYLATQSQLQIQDGLSAILLYVQTPATPDTHPVRPLVFVNAVIGFACGLLFGILLVLAQAQLDQRVRSAEDAVALLGYPLLADATAMSTGLSSGHRRAVFQDRARLSAGLYPTLQRAIEFLSIDRPIRAVAVTGARTSDAPGIVSAAWATLLARSGRRTLLVDADLQHPSLAAYFGVDAPGGLSDAALALHQGEPGAAVLQRYLVPGVQMGLPALSVLLAGAPPPNPGRVLESQAMGQLFRTLLSIEAEMAIFTTPSARGHVAATSLETNVDGVVFVVELLQARRPQLMRLKARLAETGAHVLGIVTVTREGVDRALDRRRTVGPSAGPHDHASASATLDPPAGLAVRRREQ